MAESGDPEAQYWLGRIYEAGRLLTLDMEKSAYWYQKSADQGYAPAEYSACGRRAQQDSLENERCLWRAAEKGVPEAQFWLGESLFQRQRYDAAAQSFLDLSTKYGTHAKAPDALLRLGQSLAALKQKEMACATFAEVGRKYPKASASVKQGVEREQKRVQC